MDRASADLMAEVFPSVPLRSELADYQGLISTARAKEHLGFIPGHSWRDEPLRQP